MSLSSWNCWSHGKGAASQKTSLLSGELRCHGKFKQRAGWYYNPPLTQTSHITSTKIQSPPGQESQHISQHRGVSQPEVFFLYISYKNIDTNNLSDSKEWSEDHDPVCEALQRKTPSAGCQRGHRQQNCGRAFIDFSIKTLHSSFCIYRIKFCSNQEVFIGSFFHTL